MHQIFLAVRTVLHGAGRVGTFLVLSALIFSLLFFLQVRLIPGNDVSFQASLLGYGDWTLLALISLANALFVLMQVHMFKVKREHREKPSMLGGIVLGGFGSSSGVIASLFGVATCGLCISALFSFLGANAVLYLVSHRGTILIGALALLATSLFITARRFHTTCETCRVPPKD